MRNAWRASEANGEMTTLVADCPRCGTSRITFDVKGFVVLNETEYSWKHFAEAFCACRHCGRTTIFRVAQRQPDHKVIFAHDQWRVDNKSLNSFVEVVRFIGLRDRASHNAPDHVPAEMASAFAQGATCLSVECWDAAAAMFRKTLDLATAPLLPEEEEAGLNNRVRRNLGLRLPWLFENNKLPVDLRALADCIREDGNDAAHTGTLTKDDALDAREFTRALLERIYTEPGKLKEAQLRRAERRATG